MTRVKSTVSLQATDVQGPSKVDRGRRMRRRAIQPWAEIVENRTLLTGSPLVIAALGDSLTDEYMFYGAATPPPPTFPLLTSTPPTTLPPEIYLTGRDAARNWVMTLAATRPTEATFGNFTISNRGQTRNQGYQENWAENGAAASGPDVSGSGITFAEEYEGIPQEFTNGPDPMPGLITQNDPSDISIKNINVVGILIGANDYNAALAAYSSQSDPADTSVFNQANTNIENAIATAISSIQAAATAAGNSSLKFVLITTPNITVAPLIQDEAGSSLPELETIIGEKIDLLDSNLQSTYGSNPAVGIVNSTEIVENFIANPVLDGVTVNMEGAGQDYTDGFTGDGFHPGTIVQSLVLQSIVSTINALEGSQIITPITDADIVNFAKNSQPSISFTSSASTTTVGQGSTFTATLTPAALSSPIPTGTVTFEQILPGNSSEPAHPGLILGTVHLSDKGIATLTAYHLPKGTYTIAAIYNGDFLTVARRSSTLTQVVTSTPAPTSTKLYATPNPAAPGQPVSFTAIVTADGTGLPTPGGIVTFRDVTTSRVLGTASLNAHGIATLKTAKLAIGSNKIVASYGGTTMLATSTSTTLVETVNAPPPPPPPNPATTTTIIPSYVMADGGLKVSLQVIVKPVDPTAPLPTGQVQVGVGPYRVLTVTLNQGKGVITLPYSQAARRLVSAFYLGNGVSTPSGSPFVEVNARHNVSATSSRAAVPQGPHRSVRPAQRP